MADNEPMPRIRLRAIRARRRTYVDAGDLVDLLRVRARAYRRRADDLVDDALTPTGRDPEEGDPVAVLDESLACRMVAEELEQRADALEQLHP